MFSLSGMAEVYSVYYTVWNHDICSIVQGLAEIPDDLATQL